MNTSKLEINVQLISILIYSQYLYTNANCVSWDTSTGNQMRWAHSMFQLRAGLGQGDRESEVAKGCRKRPESTCNCRISYGSQCLETACSLPLRSRMMIVIDKKSYFWQAVCYQWYNVTMQAYLLMITDFEDDSGESTLESRWVERRNFKIFLVFHSSYSAHKLKLKTIATQPDSYDQLHRFLITLWLVKAWASVQ